MAIIFSELKIWAISSLQSSVYLPDQWTKVKVGDVVKQINSPQRIVKGYTYKLMGVKWYGGGVFHRETIQGHQSSANTLHKLVSGAFVYNRLFAWKGSFAVVPQNIGEVWVSNEFPQFSVNSERLSAEYLYLYCMTERVNRAVNRASTGAAAVSRNRFKEKSFLEFELALPPLTFQKAIIKQWQDQQDKITAALADAQRIEQQAEREFLQALGLSLGEEQSAPQRKAFAVRWAKSERWDTGFFQDGHTALIEQISKNNFDELAALANLASRGWAAKDFPSGEFRYIEISAVNKELGIFQASPVALSSAPSRATTLIKQGDIILATTRPYLAAFAAVPKEYDHCICSSGFALIDSVDETRVTKEYLLEFLKSEFSIRQIKRRMAGASYPAITLAELSKLLIPTPALDLQKRIVESRKNSRASAKSLRQQAAKMKADAAALVEAAILGKKVF